MFLLRPFVTMCALACLPGYAQESGAKLPDVSLAAVMQQPSVRVDLAREIGRLESGASRIVITVLIVHTTDKPDQPIRAVRLDLDDAGFKDTAYLTSDQALALKGVLDQLSLDLPGSLPQRSRQTGTALLGSCEFRDHPERYPVTLSYCYAGGCAPGLLVTSPVTMSLPRRTPAELSALLAKAIEEGNTR